MQLHSISKKMVLYKEYKQLLAKVEMYWLSIILLLDLPVLLSHCVAFMTDTLILIS